MISIIVVAIAQIYIQYINGNDFSVNYIIAATAFAFVFWMWMFIDCIVNRNIIKNSSWWIALFILINWVTSFLYFFIIVLNRHEK